MDMNNQSLESSAAATAAAAGEKTNSAILAHAPKAASLSLAQDPYSALITPTKAIAEQLQQQQQLLHQQQQSKKRQLQLTAEKSGLGAPSSSSLLGNNNDNKVMVLKKHKKKKSPAAIAEAMGEQQPTATSIKWPPVSSSKSLPPLSGRVSDLLMADVSSNTGKVSSRDTIEFEVNQECECFDVVLLPWVHPRLFSCYFIATNHSYTFSNNDI